MQLHQLGLRDYDEYVASPYFQKLRDRVGVGKKKCRRCHKRPVRIPHHLNYLFLGNERKRDVVGICHSCNRLAHFYDDGRRVLVTRDGVFLTRRWKEINSLSYKARKVKPSQVISFIWRLRKLYQVG